jgi:hypothetical protein
MYFLYVYTEATANVGDTFSVPVSISLSERDSCVKGDIAVIRQLVESNDTEWDTVIYIEVETEIDPDPDSPATAVCWSR